jgi:hypothetical protein
MDLANHKSWRMYRWGLVLLLVLFLGGFLGGLRLVRGWLPRLKYWVHGYYRTNYRRPGGVGGAVFLILGWGQGWG